MSTPSTSADPIVSSLIVPPASQPAAAVVRIPELVEKGATTRAIFEALSGIENAWSHLRSHTTLADASRLLELCAIVCPDRAEELFVRFYEIVVESVAAQSPRVRSYFEALPENWYGDSALYYSYPHSLGVADGQKRGTLENFRAQLPYLQKLGFRNIQMLPHWKSAGGDGGYDISGFVVDPALGGEEAFRHMMDDVMGLGLRIITDFIPNHISVRHPWFQALLAGDESKLDWFLVMDDATLIGTELDAKGRTRVLLQNGRGQISKPWAIFPHASKRNLIDIEVNGKKHQVFHSFYPFQVDLNLRNPVVLGELFKVLGWEASLGVAGKRMDAAPHWFKEEGTNFENLTGTHALQALFKLFYRHVVQKSISVPEVGEGLIEASLYFGQRVEMLNRPSNSAGDAMFGFEWNSTMWAMLLDEDPSLFWTFIARMDQLPPHTFWFNLGRHHDELRTDLMPDAARERIEQKLSDRGAQVFAGRGVGGRMADFLAHDPQQIAKAFWLNFMPPSGVPVVYYGDEIGARNQPDFMAQEQQRRLPILTELGFPVGDGSAALDTRDVGRGGVPATLIEQAQNAAYLPLETVRALNALWAQRPSLRSGSISQVEVRDGAKVLALVKWAESKDAPLLGLCNLGDQPVRFQLKTAELRRTVWSDVLAQTRGAEVRTLDLREAGEWMFVELAAHEHLLLSH